MVWVKYKCVLIVSGYLSLDRLFFMFFFYNNYYLAIPDGCFVLIYIMTFHSLASKLIINNYWYFLSSSNNKFVHPSVFNLTIMQHNIFSLWILVSSTVIMLTSCSVLLMFPLWQHLIKPLTPYLKIKWKLIFSVFCHIKYISCKKK